MHVVTTVHLVLIIRNKNVNVQQKKRGLHACIINIVWGRYFTALFHLYWMYGLHSGGGGLSGS